jgi:hypothetical protein
MLNAAAPGQVLHMNVAAMVAIGFAATGVHAWYLRREPDSAFHRRALPVALALAIVAALAQPLTGHVVAEHTARAQPVKLAAAEAQWETMRGAPLTLRRLARRGHRDHVVVDRAPVPAVDPRLRRADAEVTGLKEVPPADRPPVAVVHVAYQVMLGLGTAMAGLSFAAAVTWLRRREAPDGPRLAARLHRDGARGPDRHRGGWTVTEVGRQPWVIYGVMRTADAVTPVARASPSPSSPTRLYAFLGVHRGAPAAPPVLARAARRVAHAAAGGAMTLYLAGLVLACLVLYALLAGADFGGGTWDLLATGPRADDQRRVIERAMGPVWEANHVWLIAVIVLLFACFPRAYSHDRHRAAPAAHPHAVRHRPARHGLRLPPLRHPRRAGVARLEPRCSPSTSAITPYMLGVCLGAAASGRIRVDAAGRVAPEAAWAWLAPFPLAVGALTVAVFAFLAAVYLRT